MNIERNYRTHNLKNGASALSFFKVVFPRELWAVLGKTLKLLVILKACVRYSLSNFYFSPNGSPSGTMKNVFYFI